MRQRASANGHGPPRWYNHVQVTSVCLGKRAALFVSTIIHMDTYLACVHLPKETDFAYSSYKSVSFLWQMRGHSLLMSRTESQEEMGYSESETCLQLIIIW